MQKFLYLLFCIALVSCKKEKKEAPLLNNETITVESNKTALPDELSSKLENWKKYYLTNDSTFDFENFQFKDSLKINRIEGSVPGVFQEEFDSVYLDFLIYSENKDKYIDFDSYWWFIYDDEISFEADQEVNLVNINEKTVERIGFSGPSEWVEDAIWLNDKTVVLVGNNHENTPFIRIANLNRDTYYYYLYKKPLSFRSEYFKKRLKTKTPQT